MRGNRVFIFQDSFIRFSSMVKWLPMIDLEKISLLVRVQLNFEFCMLFGPAGTSDYYDYYIFYIKRHAYTVKLVNPGKSCTWFLMCLTSRDIMYQFWFSDGFVRWDFAAFLLCPTLACTTQSTRYWNRMIFIIENVWLVGLSSNNKTG